MVPLKLNQKLLFFWLTSIIISLLIFASVFVSLNNRLNRDAIYQKIDQAFSYLRNHVDERDGLRRNVGLFSARADIVSSLSLIHKYQNPDAYQPIIFDTEKKALATELLELLKVESITVISAYDGNMRLAGYAYLDDHDQMYSGYVSYHNGSPEYFVSSAELKNYQQVKLLPYGLESVAGSEEHFTALEPHQVAMHVHVHNEKVTIGFHASVVRRLQDQSEQIVGVIFAARSGDAFAEQVSKDSNLDFIFSVDGGDWIAAEKDDQEDHRLKSLSAEKLVGGNLESWQRHNQDDYVYGVANYLLDDGRNLKFVFEVLRLNPEHVILQQAMLVVLLVNFFILFPLGFYFLKRTVLYPVKRLVGGFESLSHGQYKQLSMPSGNDELTFLTSSFNSMVRAIKARENELQKMLLAVEQSPVSMIVTDLNGDIEYVNSAFTEITGYDFYEVLGKNMRMLQGGEVEKGIYQQPWNCIIKGEQWHGVLRNRKKNGDLLWESITIIPIKAAGGNIINYLAIGEDITRRRQAEERLHLKSAALEAAADGVMITDLKGTIEWVNPAHESITGYAFAEVVGQNTSMLKSGFYDSAFYAQLWATINSGKTWYGEIYNKHKNGSIYLEQESITPVLDESGSVMHFVAIKRDITAQRQQEQQLRRSQKMDALGKLTGGIAHDYNNMLGIILGYSDLLKTFLADQPKLQKYADEIQRAGERGARLTRKLLSFSRHESTEADVLDLNALLEGERHMLETTLTARIKLKHDLSEDLWLVWLDSSDLVDAIINLSINAMHAIEGNGELVIQTWNQHLDIAEAKLLDLDQGDYVLLSITDTGEGMDEATKEKIFDPFFSSKGDKGTGLGLSQVYGFVERSGGTIKVHSELHHGTCFTLYFPRQQETDDHPHVDSNHPMNNTMGSETILLVDDELSLLTMADDRLRQQGYKVFIAQGARQALELLEHEKIDLLLSDVIMPEMNGYQLAAIVTKKYPAVKIQMISGFNDDRHLDIADERLYKNQLHKPCNAPTMLKRIRLLLDESSTES